MRSSTTFAKFASLRTFNIMALPRGKFYFKLFSTLIALFFVTLAVASPISAHSSVIKTVPSDGEVLLAPPSEIEIFFNENVTMASKGITLYDSEGSEVALSAPRVETSGSEVIAKSEPLQELEESWYAVSWRAISQDGHPIQGSFTFNAGSVTETYNPNASIADPTALYRDLGNILRSLGYLAIILTIGFFAAIYILSPSKPAVSFSSKLALTSIGLGLIVTPLVIVNNAIILNGGSFDDFQPAFMIALQSSTGTALLLRIAAYFGLATAVLLSSEKGMRVISAIIGFASSAALAVSFAISGHANAVNAVNLAGVSIVVHVLAGAIWIGGIPALAWALRKKSNISPKDLVAVVDRFSIAATVSVLLVLGFGIAAAFTMFDEFEDIFTEYGYALLVKFALVSLIALLGVYNHFVVVPSLHAKFDEQNKEIENTDSELNSDSKHESLDSSENSEGTEDSNSVKTENSEDIFKLSLNDPVKHLRNLLKVESLAVVAIVIATGYLTSFAAPAAGGSHLEHLGLTHSHSSALDPGVLSALAELEPKIAQSKFGDGEVQVNYRPGRSDRENELSLLFYDKSGKETAVTNIKISFTHTATGVGPIERVVETVDGRNILNTRDLGIPGQWTMEITAQTGGLGAASSEVTLDIKAPPTPEDLTTG